jgi:hypothetical protein
VLLGKKNYYGHSVAHRSKCTYYEKCILNVFQNVRKFGKKILGVHLNILCYPSKFYGEKTNAKTCHVNSNFV